MTIFSDPRYLLFNLIMIVMIQEPSPAMNAFQKENYLEPAVGAVKNEFTLNMKVGHRFTEHFAIEVSGLFTPQTEKKYSLMIYTAAFKANIPELSFMGGMEPFVSLAFGSYTIIGQGRRYTDPLLVQKAGFNLRFNQKVSLVLESGNMTDFGEDEIKNVHFYLSGLAFMF